MTGQRQASSFGEAPPRPAPVYPMSPPPPQGVAQHPAPFPARKGLVGILGTTPAPCSPHPTQISILLLPHGDVYGAPRSHPGPLPLQKGTKKTTWMQQDVGALGPPSTPSHFLGPPSFRGATFRDGESIPVVPNPSGGRSPLAQGCHPAPPAGRRRLLLVPGAVLVPHTLTAFPSRIFGPVFW